MTAKASLYSNILEDSRACVPLQAPSGFSIVCLWCLRGFPAIPRPAEQPVMLSAPGWAEGFSVFPCSCCVCVPGRLAIP